VWFEHRVGIDIKFELESHRAIFYVQLATAHLRPPLPPLPPFPPLPPLCPSGGAVGGRGVGNLVEAGRAYVTLGHIFCFFVAEF
jgi:hypothetical protein